MRLMGRQVKPGSGAGLVLVRSQSKVRFALEEEQHRWFGGGVFGKGLSRRKTEQDRLHRGVLENRPAHDPILGRGRFLY
jgi:hypothetical protein